MLLSNKQKLGKYDSLFTMSYFDIASLSSAIGNVFFVKTIIDNSRTVSSLAWRKWDRMWADNVFESIPITSIVYMNDFAHAIPVPIVIRPKVFC